MLRISIRTFFVVLTTLSLFFYSHTEAIVKEEITIKILQTFLENKGLLVIPVGDIKGNFGPKTKEALLTYQKQNNLKETGILDEETKERITNDLNPKPEDLAKPIVEKSNTKLLANVLSGVNNFFQSILKPKVITKTNIAQVSTTTVSNITPPNPQITQIVNNPIVERVVEKVVINSLSPNLYMTREETEEKLNQLDNKLVSKIAQYTTGGNTVVNNIYQQIAHSQKIDRLTGTAISGATFTGGSITDSSISATSLSSPSLTLSNLNGPLHANNGVVSSTTTIGTLYGGTGLDLSASSGVLNFYNGTAGTIATSSLGLLTTDVAEGANLYYTNTRVNSYIHASTTIPKLYTANTFTNTNIFSGNVGIGTTNPNGPLYINSSSNVYDIVSIQYGSAKFLNLGSGTAYSSVGFDSSGAFAVNSETSRAGAGNVTRMFVTGTGDVALGGAISINSISDYTGGSLYIKSGNVGIGTTSPVSLTELYSTTIPEFNITAGTDVATVDPVITFRTGATSIDRVTMGYDYSAYAFKIALGGALGIGADKVVVDSSGVQLKGSVGVGDGFSSDNALSVERSFSSTDRTSIRSSISSISGVNKMTGIYTMVNSGSDIMVNSYPLYVANGSGTITNQYGLYIENLTTATNNYAVYSAGGQSYFAGNIGIGKTNPVSKLEVNGDIRMTSGSGAVLYFADGTSMSSAGAGSANSVSATVDAIITGDSDANSTGDVILKTGSADRLHILNTGNVGIGITNPTSALHVVSNSNGANFSIQRSASSQNNGMQFNDQTGSRIAQIRLEGYSTNDLQFMTGLNNIRFYTNTDFANSASPTNERMRIDNTGNVGIGTTSPSQLLTVNAGNILVTESANTYHSIGIQRSGSLIGSLSNSSGRISLEAGNGYDAQVINFQGNGLIIKDTSGNVGIGTTNPGSKLDVVGSIKAGATSKLYFNTDITYVGSETVNVMEVQGYDHTTIQTYSDGLAPQYISFAPRQSEAMRIIPGGNVGIGTTGPGSKLEVSTGATESSIRISSNTGNYRRLLFVDNASSPTKLSWEAGTQEVDNAFGIFPSTTIGGTTFDTTKGVMILSNGNVGIGTTGSWAKFQVTGGGTVEPSLTHGTASTFSIVGNTDSVELAGGQSVNSPYPFWLQVRHASVDQAYPLSLQPLGGNVGIGTMNPQYGNLEVKATAPKIRLTGSAGNTSKLAFGTTGDDAYVGAEGTSGDLVFGAGSGAPERIRVLYSTGNVGIGTTNPTTGKLVTIGTISAQSGTAITDGRISMRGQSDASSPYASLWGYRGDNLNNVPLVFQEYGGNVGVGTTTPSTLFEIFGSNQSLSIDVASGSQNYMGYKIAGVPYGYTGSSGGLISGGVATDMAVRAENNLLFSTSGGNERMRLTSAGNVGIGTTGPGEKVEIYSGGISLNNPLGTGTSALFFKVAGADNMYIYRPASSNDLRIQSSSAGAIMTFGQASGNVGIGTTNPGQKLHIVGDIYTGVNGNGYIRDLGTVAMYTGKISTNPVALVIDSTLTKGIYIEPTNGNVGVGITSPTGALQVRGSARTQGTALGQIIVDSTGAYNTSPQAGIVFENKYHNDGSYALMGGIRVGKANTTDVNYSSFMAFDIRNNGSNPNEAVRIDNSGNVGIGTTGPGALLHLGKSGASAELWLQRTDGYTATKLIGGALADGNGFKINVGGSDRLAIDASTGNVGIGTTTPATKLQVNSTTIGQGIISVSSPASGFNQTMSKYQFYNSYSPWDAGWGTQTLAEITTLTGADSHAVGNMTFSVKKATANISLTEIMRITNGGNVGIGTTNPGTLLTVSGSGYFTADFRNSHASGASTYYTSTATGGLQWQLVSTADGNGFGGGKFSIAKGDGTASYFTVVQSSGNVGIGTTNPGAKFEVVGASSAVGQGLRITNTAGKTFELQAGVSGVSNDALGIYDVTSGAYRMMINTSGNVGIGTTGPSEKLHTVGNGIITGSLRVGTANAGNGQLSIRGSGTTSSTYSLEAANSGGATRFIVRDDGMSAFYGSDNSEKVRITETGNVGIGMTNPQTKLHVGGSTDTQISLGSIDYGGNSGQAVAAIQSLETVGSGGQLLFQTNPWNNSSGIGFYAPQTRMMINEYGNVGIGTTNPRTRLDISGNLRLSQSYWNTESAAIEFATDAGASLTNSIVAYSTNSDGYYGFRFKGGSGTTNGTLMTISGQGNVGIGTTDPQDKLHVAGTTTSANDYQVIAQGAGGGYGAGYSFQSVLTGGAIAEMARIVADGESTWNTTPATQIAGLTFFTKNEGTLTARMKIGGNGNVGIGTTSSGAKLHVEGSANSEINLGRFFNTNTGGSSAASVFIGQGTSYGKALSILHDYTNQVASLVIYGDAIGSGINQEAGGFVGIGILNPSVALDVTGDIEYTGTITDVSDQRLKENIVNIDNALNIVAGLKAKSFNMIGNTKREYGYIAQEVQTIFPDAVSIIDPENGYLGLNYISFIPLTTEALKELNLNLETISGNTASSTPTSILFSDRFFTNLYAKISTWLANAENGITKMFVGEVRTDKLCVGETCLTEEQLKLLIQNNQTQSASVVNVSNFEPTTEISEPEVVVGDVVTPEVVEDPVVTEPAPEVVVELEPTAETTQEVIESEQIIEPLSEVVVEPTPPTE